MRVVFVTMASLRQGPGGPTSDLASARYRVALPAQHLSRLGHAVQLMSLPQGGSAALARDLPCDAVVLSKSYFPGNEQFAAALKARGVRVVADFCDDHFARPQIGDHFRRLAEAADVVVASTNGMAEVIRNESGREAIVITDPVEGPRREPRFAPGLPALRLLWFGHPSNLTSIEDRVEELRQLVTRLPVHLTVLTESNPDTRDFAARLGAADPNRLQVEFRPWSIESTWAALERCDVVWLPMADAQKNVVKSPNRLVESLWAGRVVVADSIPSYEPFADLVPIGIGLERGVLQALADPEAARARLAEAQRRIAREHSGFECGRRWAAALGDTAARPLRLNLGCGDKILPGYVNVDVVEARAGARPDVVCDLHRLSPFDDGCADEILSVHVVEHFWRWEVADILREWTRVLKRGGRLILECPNILSACRTFLENPDQSAREDAAGQRTMWVFYGDPKWKDPLMIHRWGYTPESLKALLREVGLAEVRQEPAQFKLREPRDMRIVGVKP